MNQREMIQWARKGLLAEIDLCEITIGRGRRLLEDCKQGIPIKAKKSPEEIRQVITEQRQTIEDLQKKRFDLEWQLANLDI